MTMRLGRSRSPMRTGVRRGWTDMTALLDKGSSGGDGFAGSPARLDEAMGVRDIAYKSDNLVMTKVGKPVKPPASLGISHSTNRENRVLKAPATDLRLTPTWAPARDIK